MPSTNDAFNYSVNFFLGISKEECESPTQAADKKQELADHKLIPEQDKKQGWKNKEKFIKDKEAFDAIKKLQTLSKENKSQILSLYHCFMHHKDLMCIPHKPERDALAKLDPEKMTNSDSRAIRQILQDKIVLDNVRFIDDYNELIRIAENMHKTSIEKEQTKFKKEFDTKIRNLIMDFNAKGRYIQTKLDHVEWIKNKSKPEVTSAHVDKAFEAYCKVSCYLPKLKIPDEFKQDKILHDLMSQESALHDPFNNELGKYFGGKIRVTDHSLMNDLSAEFKETTQTLIKDLKTASNKFKMKRDQLLHASKGEIQTNPLHDATNIDNTLEKNLSGQFLLKEDTLLKQLLVDERNRIKKLAEAQGHLLQSKAQCRALKKEMDALNKTLGFATRRSRTQKIQKGFKKLVHGLVGEAPYDLLLSFEHQLYNKNLKKQDLEDDLAELKKYQALQNEIIQLETQCNQLITHINQAEKEMKLSVGLHHVYKNIKQLHGELQAFSKRFKKQFANFLGQDKTPELEESYQAEIAAFRLKKQALEEALAQLALYGKTKHELKEKSLNIQQIDKRLAHITQLNNDYWANLMRVQFEPVAAQMQPFMHPLNDYFIKQQANLARVLEKPSFYTQLLKGTAYAAGGAAIGGGLGFLTKLANPFSLLDPFSTMQSTLIGSALGGAIGAVIFAGWRSEPGNEIKSLERFHQEMREIGFHGKQYEALTERIAQLFTYRDCLLSSKKAGNNKNLRADFIHQNPDLAHAESAVIDAAIETYFITHLGHLINTSFTELFALHDEHIKKGNSLFRYLTKWCNGKEYAKDREVFTSKMQIEFLQGIANYLQAKMDEPGFLVEHRLEMRILAGVCLAGAVAIGVFLGVSFGFGIPLGLCILGALAGLGLPHLPYFELKRSPKDRDSLEKAKKAVVQERERLEKAGSEVVAHGLEQQQHLERIQADAKLGTLDRIFNAITASTWENKIGLGTVDAWLREYSERYRHNIITAVDFKSVIRTIMKKAAELTEEMQTELAAGMIYTPQGMDTSNIEHFKGLKKFIKDSRKFLNGTDEQSTKLRLEFNSFNMKQKIREQILEIVSVVPSTIPHKLPVQLVEFYKELGGSEEDLEAIRRLHSVDKVKTAASGLNFDMSNSPTPIFAGNDTYRLMLGRVWGKREFASGLTVRLNSPPIEPLSKKNIVEYLNNSYAFLLSLDANTPMEMTLTQEYPHSEKYILYRTLLIKQLAELVDHAHEKYSASLEEDILEFARNKLHVDDPKSLFREVQHQGYVTEKETFGKSRLDAKYDSEDEKERLKTFDAGIVDAIRVGILYDSKVTPKSLIQKMIHKIHLDNKTLFGFNPNTPRELGVQLTDDYLSLVNQAIGDTEKLLYEIIKNPLLKNFNVPNCLIHSANDQAETLTTKLAKIKRLGVKLNPMQRRPLTMAEETIVDTAIQGLQRHQDKFNLVQLIHQKTAPGRQIPPPFGHLKFSFEPKVYGLYKEVPSTTQEQVEAELKKALLDHSGIGNAIHFDLRRLAGSEPWKITLKAIIDPFLSSEDKQKVSFVSEEKQEFEQRLESA